MYIEHGDLKCPTCLVDNQIVCQELWSRYLQELTACIRMGMCSDNITSLDFIMNEVILYTDIYFNLP